MTKGQIWYVFKCGKWRFDTYQIIVRNDVFDEFDLNSAVILLRVLVRMSGHQSSASYSGRFTCQL